jgi:hypothetical protein
VAFENRLTHERGTVIAGEVAAVVFQDHQVQRLNLPGRGETDDEVHLFLL